LQGSGTEKSPGSTKVLLLCPSSGIPATFLLRFSFLTNRFIFYFVFSNPGDNMLMTNTPDFPGKQIEEILGIVRGNTIRARWFGRDIAAGFKTLVGGEIKSYTEMLTKARDQAIERMVDDAKSLKADAVVNVRFATSDVMQGAAEVMVYGTAVKFK